MVVYAQEQLLEIVIFQFHLSFGDQCTVFKDFLSGGPESKRDAHCRELLQTGVS